MELHHIRTGTGEPLLLLHGLGGSWRSWTTSMPALTRQREVIAVDLPRHGASPPTAGTVGQMAIQSAWMMGAGRVILIDRAAERLALSSGPGRTETINFDSHRALLSDAPMLHKTSRDKADGCTKVVLTP